MKIGIQGWGSEGDLRPLVALGERLLRAGHEVHLVLSPVDRVDWDQTCRALGLVPTLVPGPGEMGDTLEAICEASQSPDPSKVSRKLMELAFFPYQERMYEAALRLCERSDLVVGLFSSTYVKAACLKTGTPFVSVHYYPGMVPSRLRAPPMFPDWRWLNPVSWALFGAILDVAFKGPTAKFFASKGLPKIRRSVPDALMSERLNLLACSPSLFSRPDDWSEAYQLCGDFVLPASASAWEPPADLQAFFDAGSKPVLVSLGTMEHLAPERARALVLDAVRLAGVRAIVQSKCRPDEGRDGDVYFLRWAPHARLVPRCSAMVVHGGAGTTHAALRGGVPGVVLPFIFEQGLWGGLLHRAGSAPRPISFWKATPGNLAAALREATASETLRQRAAELAKQVATEDGTGSAVALLERLGREAALRKVG